MDSTSEKLSPFDLMTAILRGVKFDQSNGSSEVPPALVTMLMENRDLIMVLTTSVAVLIGCVVVLVWRRTAGSAKKAVEPPKLVIPKAVAEPEEVDDGKKKVTIFFGTQTGTAEGFAKVKKSTFLLFCEEKNEGKGKFLGEKVLIIEFQFSPKKGFTWIHGRC